MRKRTASKKKDQLVAKAATDQNQKLDSLFNNVNLIRRDWYTPELHANVMETLKLGKLQTIKKLMDLSREKDGDSNRYGLKDLKDFIDQFSVVQTSVVPAFKQIDRNIVDKVVDLINDEIQDDYSTTGLSHLLSHVPVRVLQDYYDSSKD